MEHLEVVSLDGAMRVESHQGIDLHKEEKGGGVHCVYMYVCTHAHLELCVPSMTSHENNQRGNLY